MRLLLDTHVFLWYLAGETRLPASMRDAIRDPANEAFLNRLLVAQALQHDLTLVTVDPQLNGYPAKRFE